MNLRNEQKEEEEDEKHATVSRADLERAMKVEVHIASQQNGTQRDAEQERAFLTSTDGAFHQAGYGMLLMLPHVLYL